MIIDNDTRRFLALAIASKLNGEIRQFETDLRELESGNPNLLTDGLDHEELDPIRTSIASPDPRYQAFVHIAMATLAHVLKGEVDKQTLQNIFLSWELSGLPGDHVFGRWEEENNPCHSYFIR